jgi:hypothetical protein
VLDFPFQEGTIFSTGATLSTFYLALSSEMKLKVLSKLKKMSSSFLQIKHKELYVLHYRYTFGLFVGSLMLAGGKFSNLNPIQLPLSTITITIITMRGILKAPKFGVGLNNKALSFREVSSYLPPMS